MSETTPIVQFPVPSETTLWILGAGFASMLALAIYFERRRRVQSRQRRLTYEWRSVADVMENHGLPDTERKRLKALIKKHAANAPLRAVTVRRAFDDCVEAEMTQLANAVDAATFEKEGQLLRDIRGSLGLDYVSFGQRIDSTRNLHSGQMLQLANDADADVHRTHRMMVEAVDEAHFEISHRGMDGAPPPILRKGNRVRCHLWRDEDGRYAFETHIMGKGEIQGTWKVAHTHDLTRTQARSHFRVRVDQNTAIGLLNAPKDDTAEDLSTRRVLSKIRGRITSLSAGGCALVLNQAVAKHVLLRIQLDLGEGESPVSLEAKLVSCIGISGGRYLVRVNFVGLDDDRRDRVARYVLHRQQLALANHEEVEPHSQ